MPKKYRASISLSAHREAMGLLNFRQLLLRIQSHEVNFDLRFIQAEELEKKILEELEVKHDDRKPAISNFRHFIESRTIEIRGENIPISKKIFIAQKKNLNQVIEQLLRGNYFIDDKLTIIEKLLSRNQLIEEGIFIGEEIEEEINYEIIVCSKELISIDRASYSEDAEYLKLLDSIYLYYTQFWRMMEILGDFYNDIQVIRERRGTNNDIDSFFEGSIQFSHTNPLDYIVIKGRRIYFSILESLLDKQSIVLLYTLLTFPGESMEAIKTYYEVTKEKFGLRHGSIKLDTLERQYISRLNVYLKNSGIKLKCKRDFIGPFLEEE